jgi:hypothetical protein
VTCTSYARVSPVNASRARARITPPHDGQRRPQASGLRGMGASQPGQGKGTGEYRNK